MKQLKHVFHSTGLTHTRRALWTGLATLAIVALASSALPNRAQAEGGGRHDDEDGAWLRHLHAEAQVAQLLQLAADFHGALSYNGDPATKSANLTAMTNIWADGSSLSFSNTVTMATSTYTGKDAVLYFLATGGYFLHNWVSLAPEYKTQITVHGDTAEISTQCVAIDLTVTPMVVKAVIQVNATAVNPNPRLSAWRQENPGIRSSRVFAFRARAQNPRPNRRKPSQPLDVGVLLLSRIL